MADLFARTLKKFPEALQFQHQKTGMQVAGKKPQGDIKYICVVVIKISKLGCSPFPEAADKPHDQTGFNGRGPMFADENDAGYPGRENNPEVDHRM